MNKKKKAEISAFYDLYKKEKGEKMFYKFKCENCGKVQEVEIAIKDYDTDKDKRIIELEAQIEKMKCCANCKKYWRMCEYGDREMQICEKWEIAEND